MSDSFSKYNAYAKVVPANLSNAVSPDSKKQILEELIQ